MRLTKHDALLAELEPYTPSPSAINKALLDAGVNDSSEEYSATDKRAIAVAAVMVLRKLTVLASDSLGKSSQSYSVEKLEERIRAICKENGMEAENFVNPSSVTDCSDMW